MNLTTDNPDFDLLQLDLSDPFYGYLGTRLHLEQLFNMGIPVENNDPVFSYQIPKSALEVFDPKDQSQVSLLQVNTTAESIAVQAVYYRLPVGKQTKENLTALSQCCYYSPSDFAGIAQRYQAPVVVVPLQDLFLRISTSSTHVWGHLL